MNKKIILLTVTSSLLLLSIILQTPIGAQFHLQIIKPVKATSTEIIVQPGNSIQEAINNANTGDTILVKNGTYYEHVIVNKALSLVGENKHDTIIDGNKTGVIVILTANNVALSNFTIQKGELGIWFRYSTHNIVTSNIVSNNSYGLHLWGASNNIFTGNIVSNNWHGIYLHASYNNIFTGNIVSNNWDGIYLEGSGNNALSGNNVSSNNNDGVYLYHSSNNVFSGNTASNNQYGIYISDSDNNVFSGNTASNNQYGIYVEYSLDNVLTSNIVTNNSRYGIRLSSSNNNIILHNNFINNIESSNNINSVNSWDNSAEGNYWNDYIGTDTNRDGIGDTPYTIDEKNQDNYPLMAMFLQFNITTETQSYEIGAVSNYTISNFQYHYDPYNGNTLSFKVNGTEGNGGFCRIGIPHTLINPPYTVTVNYNPPLYFKTVYTNGTHTWLYFAYDPSEHEVTIMHMPYPEQLVLSQWAILGLTVTVVILLLISIKYYRIFNQQKKVIQVYERELGSFPVSHPERARAHFIKDVIERKEKIKKFEKKYGIKIKPADTFEDLIKKLGVEKEVKN